MASKTSGGEHPLLDHEPEAVADAAPPLALRRRRFAAGATFNSAIHEASRGVVSSERGNGLPVGSRSLTPA
jgi:hypothetical protein